MAMTTEDPLETVAARGLGFVKEDTVFGLGAGHQTVWTCLVATLLQQSGER
jgi:hypothetical protein